MAKNAWLSLALLLATGCGEERSAGISAEPAEVSFDPTFVGDARVQRIEIAHTGTAGPLSVEAFAVSPATLRLEPGSEASVDVTFSPDWLDLVEETLSFRLCPGCDEMKIELAGSGLLL